MVMSEQDDPTSEVADKSSIKELPEMPKDYPWWTFGDDDPRGIDTFDECYLKSRSDLIKEAKARGCTVEVLEDEMEKTYIYGSKDHVTPCGVYNGVAETFLEKYQRTKDIELLISILEKHPVYGITAVSEEIIRLLKKARIKPMSDKIHERDRLHHAIKCAVLHENPEKGEVDAVYTAVAARLNVKIAMVKTIITRARKDGWYDQFPNWHLGKVSGDDSE
jgi:hypothetical protein